MNKGEKNIGADVLPKELKIRSAYLGALAAGMGANPLTSKFGIDAILNHSDELQPLRAHVGQNHKHDFPPEVAAQIEAIGKWFLNGSTQEEQMKFTVGSWVITIATAPIKSGYFDHLEGYVGAWTDGTGTEKFRDYLKLALK